MASETLSLHIKIDPGDSESALQRVKGNRNGTTFCANVLEKAGIELDPLGKVIRHQP